MRIIIRRGFVGEFVFHMSVLISLVLFTLMSGCGSDSTGSAGTPQMVDTQPEAAGDNCMYGGVALLTGIDADGNGALSATEADAIEYLCNGMDGSGSDGAALMETTTLAAGDDNCPFGGVQLVRGTDTNKNGVLDAAEVTDTQQVCAGNTDPIDGSAACVFPANWNSTSQVCEMRTDWSQDTLAGASLSSTYLAGVNFAGSDLSTADLRWTDLRGADFSGADLTGVDLRNANVGGADFSGATLDGAKLAGVDMGNGIFDNSTSGVGLISCPQDLPNNWTCIDLGASGNTLLAPGANLNGLDLTDANLSGNNLRGIQAINLVGCPDQLPQNWECVDLPNTGLTLVGPGVNLEGVNLTDADLSDLNLKNANLSGANLTNANLMNADLADANLDNANLTNVDLSGANLEGVNLSTATLVQITSNDLKNCPDELPNKWDCIQDNNGRDVLVGPDAILTGIDFRGADFTKADLTNASLSGANMRDTDLQGVDMSNANLSGVRADNLQNCPASLPTGWDCIQDTLVGPQVDLQGADLADFNLNGVNLTSADFSGADLSGSDLSGADLDGADMTGADLSDAKLTGASLSGAILDGVTWNNTTCPDGSNSDSNANTCVGTF